MDERNKSVKMLQEIVANSKSEFKPFIDESNNNVELCKIAMESEDLKGFFRGIHTIKGLSNLYGLSNISKDIHLLENKVSDLKSLEDNKKMAKQVDDYLDKLRKAGII